MQYKNFYKKDINIILIFILLSALVKSGSSLKFLASKPISINNGSNLGVVIDCPYELEVAKDSHGLEVKWFYNDKPRQVYQWVPGNKPQSLGRLSGRLDLSYEVSQDKSKKHRALAIPEPTLDLSGKYSCWVSNFDEEQKVDIFLVVYIPANKLYTNIESIDHDTIQISCNAEGLVPEPSLTLSKLIKRSGTYSLLESETRTEFDPENRTYSISLKRNFQHMELEESDFVCSLTIPNTDYHLEREISYYPDGGIVLASNQIGIIGLAFLTVYYSCWYALSRR